jgi:hypothetical protein
MRKTVQGGGNGKGRTGRLGMAEHGMAAGNGNGLYGEGRMRKTLREWEWE